MKRNIPKRGHTAGLYIVEHAQRKTNLRHRTKPKRILFSEGLKKRIEGFMSHQKWNPELIANRLNKESGFWLSHQTIYKWIWTAKHSKHEIMRTIKDYTSIYVIQDEDKNEIIPMINVASLLAQ